VLGAPRDRSKDHARSAVGERELSIMKIVTSLRLVVGASVLVACAVLGLVAHRTAEQIGQQGLASVEACATEAARSRLKDQVDAAVALLEELMRGKEEDPEALSRALKRIGHLRWAEGVGYMWAQSFDSRRPDDVRIVMHPVLERLVGTDMSTFRVTAGPRKGELAEASLVSDGEEMVPADPGVTTWVNANRMCARQGAGFVLFSWPKPECEVEQPKLGYFRRCAPFGVVLGAGAYIDDVQHRVDRQSEAIAASKKELGLLVGVVAGALFLSLGFVAQLLLNRVQARLAAFSGRLEELGEGDADLTARLEAGGRDEFAGMAGHFNRFVERIAGTVQEIRSGAHAVGRSSRTMSEGAESLDRQTQGLRERSAEFEAGLADLDEQAQTVASAMEEMSATIHEITASTARAKESAERGVSTVGEGHRIAGELTSSSDEIDGVSKAIRGIAEQTNLLALNATIEAARAGAAGKGFAVVAHEVKDLAQETARATEQIETRVQRLQEDVNAVVETISGIDGMMKEIADGQQMVSATLEEQLQAAAEINRASGAVAARSRDLAGSVQELRTTADGVSRVAGDSRQGVETLNRQAEGLDTAVKRFKV
jgi:methyl-accepting chemotaxis protein